MELISYAIDFTSFLIEKIKDKEKIKGVILFGSVARGEADGKSDVDIFIDVFNEKKNLEKEILKIKEMFFASVKFRKYWKLLNVNNDINIIVGELEKWKLRDSMLGNSFVLYERYKPKLENGRAMAILSWSNVKPNSKRVMLNKKLFGYNYYGKFYSGIMQKFNGRKIGSNVVIIPIEQLNLLIKTFRNFKVAVKIIRVFEYTD